MKAASSVQQPSFDFTSVRYLGAAAGKACWAKGHDRGTAQGILTAKKLEVAKDLRSLTPAHRQTLLDDYTDEFWKSFNPIG